MSQASVEPLSAAIRRYLEIYRDCKEKSASLKEARKALKEQYERVIHESANRQDPDTRLVIKVNYLGVKYRVTVATRNKTRRVPIDQKAARLQEKLALATIEDAYALLKDINQPIRVASEPAIRVSEDKPRAKKARTDSM